MQIAALVPTLSQGPSHTGSAQRARRRLRATLCNGASVTPSSLNWRGVGLSKYVLPVRVYLEDTDAQGVVYNASYFRFMERARTEWLRAQGVDHGRLLEEHGVVLVLASIEARFRAPARLSDVLYVSAAVTEARGARVRFGQEVRLNDPDGEVVCEGLAEVACKDARGGRPRRLPAALINEWNA